MVGHHQQAAVGGDARAVGLLRHVAGAEMAHRRGHEFEAAQVAVGAEERIDLVEPRPARDAAQQRAGQDGATAAEPVREALLQALFELEHGERSDPRRWPAACAPAGTARWQRHDRAVTRVA